MVMEKTEMDAMSTTQPPAGTRSPPLPDYPFEPPYSVPSCHNSAHHHHATVPMPPNPFEKSRANVVPLSLLHRYPAIVECPSCNNVTHTGIRHVYGAGTHGLAVMFFFTTGIFTFLPYVCNAMKDVRHSCMKCGKVLATSHMGGSTESHFL